MNLNEPLIIELEMEAKTTRAMLERLPAEHLGWKPHEKSRSLGEVAAHIANIPGMFITTLDRASFDRFEYRADTGSVEAILATHDRNIAASVKVLKSLNDLQLLDPWRYTYGEQVIFEMPRLVVVRTSGLNHLIHHRGQLSVYLRLLGVPLPPVYGPTADG
jgi:uncharacterized damage-inducible protein DinB